MEKLWHIHFASGHTLECIRRRKPVRLAEAYSRKRAADGLPYGDYIICGPTCRVYGSVFSLGGRR